VALRLDVAEHVPDAALLVDHERRAQNALVRPAIVLLLAPRVVRLGDLVVGIAQQVVGQAQFGLEALVRGFLVGADADDHRPFHQKLAIVVPEAACLRSAARRVVFRVKVEHHLLATVGGERHLLSCIGYQREIGGQIVHFQHGFVS